MNNQLLKTGTKAKTSGLYYTVLIMAMLFASIIFGVAFAGVKVVSPDDNLLYTFISFALSGIVIIAVTLGFSIYNKQNILQVCGYQKTSAKYYLIAFFAFVAIFFGLGNLNEIFVDFLADNFGYKMQSIVLPKFTPLNYALVILTVCALPAVAEEVAMRGVLLSGIKSENIAIKALIGGFLFSIYHMNPAQTPYQFAVGFIFSLIAIKSGSTLPTTVAHFLNNFVIVSIEYFFPTFSFYGGAGVWSVVVPGLICLVAIVILLLIDNGDGEKMAKPDKTEKTVKAQNGETTQSSDGTLKEFFLTVSVGAFACLLIWVLGLFS